MLKFLEIFGKKYHVTKFLVVKFYIVKYEDWFYVGNYE
jgi:hypothetical protein